MSAGFVHMSDKNGNYLLVPVTHGKDTVSEILYKNGFKTTPSNWKKVVEYNNDGIYMKGQKMTANRPSKQDYFIPYTTKEIKLPTDLLERREAKGPIVASNISIKTLADDDGKARSDAVLVSIDTALEDNGQIFAFPKKTFAVEPREWPNNPFTIWFDPIYGCFVEWFNEEAGQWEEIPCEEFPYKGVVELLKKEGEELKKAVQKDPDEYKVNLDQTNPN